MSSGTMEKVGGVKTITLKTNGAPEKNVVFICSSTSEDKYSYINNGNAVAYLDSSISIGKGTVFGIFGSKGVDNFID